LPKPEGDEELLAEIVRTREAGLALSDQIGDAVRDKEASRIRTLVGELESLQNRIDGIETGYGFKVCGRQDD
jgi:hypothetical protein